MTNLHIPLLKQEAQDLATPSGERITVWELFPSDADDELWMQWARHFRQHYCPDNLVDVLKAGTPYESSRADYLNNLVFPSAHSKLGPAVRAGDFAEILVSDLVEHKLGYWVPRTRFAAKQVRDESVKGVDIVAMKFMSSNFNALATDELMTVEAKAQMSGTKPKPRLQHAITDSIKDEFRKGETLNALKRRLIDQGNFDEANKVQRFQDRLKNPYVQKFGAAAVFCNSVYDAESLAVSIDTTAHPGSDSLSLMVIRAESFMQLVHGMYERAADEA